MMSEQNGVHMAGVGDDGIFHVHLFLPQRVQRHRQRNADQLEEPTQS